MRITFLFIFHFRWNLKISILSKCSTPKSPVWPLIEKEKKGSHKPLQKRNTHSAVPVMCASAVFVRVVWFGCKCWIWEKHCICTGNVFAMSTVENRYQKQLKTMIMVCDFKVIQEYSDRITCNPMDCQKLHCNLQSRKLTDVVFFLLFLFFFLSLSFSVTTTPSPGSGHARRCNDTEKAYCVNGGDCYFIHGINQLSCKWVTSAVFFRFASKMKLFIVALLCPNSFHDIFFFFFFYSGNIP